MIALAACVAGLLGLSVPEHMPTVEIKPLAEVQMIAKGTNAARGHGRRIRAAGLYYPPAVPWPHGKVVLADTHEHDRALLAHELAHHVMVYNGGQLHDERRPNWVQRRVRSGECDDT